jgi:phosphoribosyl 1,2-cyclic phosphodiesterase
MKVKFWGVRGSIATPLTTEEITEKLISAIWKGRNLELNHSSEAILDEGQLEIIRGFLDNLPIEERGTIGGNTPCIQLIPSNDEYLIIDCGSGLRKFGYELMNGAFGNGQGQAHIFISHTHWDHICGLPFFVPLYIKGNIFNFYSAHDHLEERLRAQHLPWYFPVPWEALSAERNFHRVNADESLIIGSNKIIFHELFHPGKSYSIRIEGEKGEVVVYASDAEYKQLEHSKIEEYLQFFHNADILIFDTQYTLTEALAKEDWGHSSAMIGIEMALEAKVKNLVMFHHEPTYNDAKVVSLREKADQYQQIINANKSTCNIHIAYEGLMLSV